MATTRSRINEKRTSTTETTNVRRRIQNSSSLRRNSSASAPNAGKKIRIERRCPLSSISVPLRRAPDAESARKQCPARRERRPPPRPHNFSCYPTARGEPCRQPQPRPPPPRLRLRRSLRRLQPSKAHCSRARPAVAPLRPHTVHPRNTCCKATCARLPRSRAVPSSNTSATPQPNPSLPQPPPRSKEYAPATAPLLLRPLRQRQTPAKEIPRSNPCRQTAPAARTTRLSAKEMPVSSTVRSCCPAIHAHAPCARRNASPRKTSARSTETCKTK